MANPNLIVSISGKPKAGKTHLALTFPAPIYLVSFDIGADFVLSKFKDKEIDVKKYPQPLVDSLHPKPYAKELWNTFYREYKEAVEGKLYQTYIIDTGSALYEVARYARAEELGVAQLVPWQYGEVYARLTALMQQPRLMGVNLVITNWLRDKYVNDKATGELELDGWRRTIDYVDVALGLRRATIEVMEEKKKVPKNVVITTIEDNKFSLDLNGMELTNLVYDELIAMIVGA